MASVMSNEGKDEREALISLIATQTIDQYRLLIYCKNPQFWLLLISAVKGMKLFWHPSFFLGELLEVLLLE